MLEATNAHRKSRAPPDLSSWGLWVSYCRAFPVNAALLVLLSLVAPIESLVAPILIGKLTASIADKAPVKTIVRNLVYVGILSLCVIVLYYIDLFVSQAFGVRLVTHIQEQLVKYIFITRDVGADCVPSTELAVRMRVYASFTAKRINIVRNNIVPGLIALLFQGGYLSFRIDFVLGGVILLMCAVLAIAMWVAMNTRSEKSIASARADEKSIARIGDVLDSFATVVDHHGLARELKVLDELHAQSHCARARAVMESMKLSAGVNVIAACAALVFFWRMYTKFLRGHADDLPHRSAANSSGAVTASGIKTDVSVTATTMMLETLSITRTLLYYAYDLSYSNSAMIEARCKFLEGVVSLTCNGEIKCVLRAKSGKCECRSRREIVICGALVPSPAGESAVRLENVNFSYFGSKRATLQNVSLNFAVGERTALLGQNGSGKTTVLRLILRHAIPQSGEVYIFGKPYSAHSPRAIRDQIAYANQFPILFDRSIYENIAYPKPRLRRAQIEAIIAQAGLSEFYARFPRGLDTRVGRHGASLSGGQRQIVQLTRILVQDAPIVVLDEITSAVDDAHETMIANLILSAFSGKTVIIVSHDPDFRQTVATATVSL